MAICTRLVTSSLSKSRDTCALTVGTDRWSSRGDLGVAQAAADRDGDLTLAFGEQGEPALARPRGGRPRVVAEPLDQGPGDRGGQHRLAVRDRADRLEDLHGGVSLSRKPSAPAASASTTCSSASKVVSTITRGGSGRACSARVASSPSGAASGCPSARRRAAAATSRSASRPSAASPTTSMSGARRASARARSAPAGRRRRGGHDDAVAHAAHGIQPCSTNGGPPGRGRGGRRAARRARPARPGRARSQASRCPKPSGLRITTSRPCSGDTGQLDREQAPGACLRALVMPSCTIR